MSKKNFVQTNNLFESDIHILFQRLLICVYQGFKGKYGKSAQPFCGFYILGTSKNSFLLRTAAICTGGVVRPNFVLEKAIGYACGDFDLPPCRRRFRTFS
jgi:hypothetical protein